MTDQIAETELTHVLRVDSLTLVGGYRDVAFQPGLNFVRGDITTGKTTLVRLVRGLLGNIPKHLPPETAIVRALSGHVALGERTWSIYRPTVTTKETPVEVAEQDQADGQEGIALRLPATGSGGYGEFVLTQLGLPIVLVPRARQEPTTELSPVTINDWLNYCIVTGDELDVQVFGHRETFRDLKRRWVFEIAYGLYDEEIAQLSAAVRQVDLQIRVTESESEVVRQFLASAEVGKKRELERELSTQRAALADVQQRQGDWQGQSREEPAGEIAALRDRVLTSREQLDSMRVEVRQHDAQIRDLQDLDRQLASLSKRLTRSIVADEWMVDFEFVVCPRCGHNVDSHRAEAPICYLCEQPEPETAPNRESLIREQDRVIYQIAETAQVLAERRESLSRVRAQAEQVTGELAVVSSRLDAATSEFVSSHASEMRFLAADAATREANVQWLERYLTLFERQDDQQVRLDALRERQAEFEEQIEQHQGGVAQAEENIAALEERMLEYLMRLHVPQLSDLLTVRINRSTYLPEVSTRTFDELSSQGLKTLVNVAHALAHHTVAIERRLPLPGLLVLDGVSANSGKEGLDGDRVLDMYRLLAEVSETFADRLQIIIVDNELPTEIVDELDDRIALTLSQSDRLIGSPPPREGSEAAPDDDSEVEAKDDSGSEVAED